MSRTDDYLAAFRDYQAATAKAQRLADEIQLLANEFKAWHKVQIINGETVFHGESLGVQMPLAAIPERENLKATMNAWHTARCRLVNLWKDMPQEMRAGLQSPPKLEE